MIPPSSSSSFCELRPQSQNTAENQSETPTERSSGAHATISSEAFLLAAPFSQDHRDANTSETPMSVELENGEVIRGSSYAR